MNLDDMLLLEPNFMAYCSWIDVTVDAVAQAAYKEMDCMLIQVVG